MRYRAQQSMVSCLYDWLTSPRTYKIRACCSEIKMIAWVKGPDNRFYVLPACLPGHLLTRFKDQEVGMRTYPIGDIRTQAAYWGTQDHADVWENYHRYFIDETVERRRVILNWDKLK